MDVIDISETLKANSAQLNADDLVGGPIRVQVLDVRKTNEDTGPITIRLSGGHMPWKPCKTMRRVLASAWGTNAAVWRGRWVELYCDPKVKFGGKEVGGIRIAAMSDIDKARTLNLAVTRGKKQAYTVRPLRGDDLRDEGRPTADLSALLEQSKLTEADVDGWLASQGKPPLSDVGEDKRAQFGAWLANDPSRIDEIRAHAAERAAIQDEAAEA